MHVCPSLSLPFHPPPVPRGFLFRLPPLTSGSLGSVAYPLCSGGDISGRLETFLLDKQLMIESPRSHDVAGSTAVISGEGQFPFGIIFSLVCWVGIVS